jgi:hypothetical protein
MPLQYLISFLNTYYGALLETNTIPLEMLQLEVQLPEKFKSVLKGSYAVNSDTHCLSSLKQTFFKTTGIFNAGYQ